MEKLAAFRWPIFFAVIGVSLHAAAFIPLSGAFGSSGTSFLAPGDVTVTISKPGDYTLWHETRTLIDGQVMTFPDELPPGTTIQVLEQPEGVSIPLRGGGPSSMETGGSRRISVGQLTIDRPGEYDIVVTGLEESRSFYLAEANFLRIFLTVMVFSLAGMLFLLAAIGSAVYVLIRITKRAA